jgi:hypothetical protein
MPCHAVPCPAHAYAASAPQEQYHSLTPMYYRNSAAAIIVYDITRAASFDTVKQWVRELRTMGSEETIIAIAGNKIDMDASRQVCVVCCLVGSLRRRFTVLGLRAHSHIGLRLLFARSRSPFRLIFGTRTHLVLIFRTRTHLRLIFRTRTHLRSRSRTRTHLRLISRTHFTHSHSHSLAGSGGPEDRRRLRGVHRRISRRDVSQDRRQRQPPLQGDREAHAQ